MNTYMAKASDVQRKWYIVDAEGVVLGRLASQVASILRGKNKPTYTPHVDTGDYVIVINADKVILTGKKLDQKIYYKHSGFPGGLSETPYRRLLNEKPEFVIQHAVIGMLPKGPLGRKMAKKLKVYAALFADDLIVFTAGFVRICFQSVRNESTCFIDIYMIEKIGVHEISVALVIFRTESFIFIEVHACNLRKIKITFLIPFNQLFISTDR